MFVVNYIRTISLQKLLFILFGATCIIGLSILASMEPLYALYVAMLFLLLVFMVGQHGTLKIIRLQKVALGAFVLIECNQMLNSVFGIIIFSMLIAAYLLPYLTNEKYRKLNTTNIFSYQFLFFVIWLIYALLQTIFTVHSFNTWYHVQILSVGIVVIWIISRLVNSFERLETLYKMWGVSMLCIILIGWWEILTGNHLAKSSAIELGMGNVATAGYYNVNDYCFFLSISLPIAFHWIGGKLFYKLLGFMMLLSSFYFIYVDGARLSFMLYMLLLFAYLIIMFRHQRKVLLLLISIIALSSYYYFDLILNSFNDILAISPNDESAGIREFLYTSAWGIFKNHPLGVGAGNVDYYITTITPPHSFWLEILANYGIIIFIGFVIFFIGSILKIFKAMKRDPERSRVLTPIFWSAVIFIPSCMESSSVFRFNIIWFLFAVIICTVNIVSQKSTQ